MKNSKIILIGDHEECLTAMERNISVNFPELKKLEKIEICTVPKSFELLEIYKFIKNTIEFNMKTLMIPGSIVILGLIQIKQFRDLNTLPCFIERASEKNFPLIPLMGMLVSTFPEIRLLFYNPFASLSSCEKKISQFNEVYPSILTERLKEIENFYFIFDPIGIRENVKESYLKTSKKINFINYLLPRDKFAVSMDEESSYAFLHGYLAYKLGYRCLIVTTEAIMGLLSTENAKYKIPEVSLTFEDMFLNFPDKYKDIRLSSLSKRDLEYDLLKDVSKRILVTVGHKNIPWYRENLAYIRKLGKRVRVVYKPSSGMYNIFDKSGLLKDYWKRRKGEWTKTKPRHGAIEEIGGHSAPGRLQLIGENLIDRSRRILKEAESVQDCILGATLALEAVELLGYRTPTTSLEAIALKHKLEVKAECMFYGVEYNIDVKNRIREIKNEVKSVAFWFHPKIRKRSILDAQMRIITDITRVFQEVGHFDEELECLNCLRLLNRRWSLRQPGFKGVLNLLIYPIRSYIETLVGSLRWFSLALVGWPLVLGIIGNITEAKFGATFSSLAAHISNALLIYFGLQSNGVPQDTWAHILTLLLVSGGFLHLGIFISYLYTLITRR